MKRVIKRFGCSLWMGCILSAIYVLLNAGCTLSDISGGILFKPTLLEVQPEIDVVLSGTEFTLTGTNFAQQPTGVTRVIVAGAQNGVQVLFGVELVPESTTSAILRFSPAVLQQFPLTLAPFQGTFQVEVVLSEGNALRSDPVFVNFFLGEGLWPTGQDLVSVMGFPGSKVLVSGDGFLLGSEGQSFAVLYGTFTEADGGLRYLEGLPVALDTLSRTEAELQWKPEVLGIQPGQFVGTYLLRNEHEGGLVTESVQPRQLSLTYGLPRVDGLTPAQLRRGQILYVSGAGLVPTDHESGSASLILLDGIFRLTTGEDVDLTGANSMILFPDTVEGNDKAVIVFRPLLDSDGILFGLGAVPGTFTGLATPWIVYGNENVFGFSAQVTFTVLPARQIVYIKLLPGFDDALEEFGLLKVRDEIVARIMEVVHRDYAGINVEFRLERPEDYVEYTVIEVGGADPNGANLLGLDNTEGKDVGNLRFNDVIGGFNALSEAQGYHAYGGVFVRSFFQFSLIHPLSDNEMATPRFDEVFGPVAPILGGVAAEFGEADPLIRGGVVFLSSHVLANLIGNTITHEVGHSLGLANIPGRFHNEGDHPNWIMDSGSYRPFEERAEIDGQGPAEFSPTNRSYLLDVLPPDP
jgi:hypothetical protein